MIDEDTPIELRTEAAVVMGSIAKGTDENVLSLIDEGCVSVLLKGIDKRGPDRRETQINMFSYCSMKTWALVFIYAP